MILLLILLTYFIFRRHREWFVTKKNESTVLKMSKVYNSFLNDKPDYHIIDTLQVKDDHYIVKVYNSKTNVTEIYKLLDNRSVKIGVPFLLNEYDNDLNTLEESKDLNTFINFNLRY